MKKTSRQQPSEVQQNQHNFQRTETSKKKKRRNEQGAKQRRRIRQGLTTNQPFQRTETTKIRKDEQGVKTTREDSAAPYNQHSKRQTPESNGMTKQLHSVVASTINHRSPVVSTTTLPSPQRMAAASSFRQGKNMRPNRTCAATIRTTLCLALLL